MPTANTSDAASDAGAIQRLRGLIDARTGLATYDHWYEKLWAYAWEHLVDHQYGGWYRILTRDNHKYTDEKSPAGKVDYHTMGACHELLRLTSSR